MPDRELTPTTYKELLQVNEEMTDKADKSLE